MKRLGTLLPSTLLLLLSGAPAAGQTTLHLTGGVNSAYMNFGSTLKDFLGVVTPQVSSESLGITRSAAGAAISFQVSDRWGLQLGGAYSKKGGRWNFGVIDWDADVRLETDYLEITALGKLQVESLDEFSVFVLAGPALSWESTCGVTESGYVHGQHYEVIRGCDARGPLASRRSSLDLGLAVGGTAEFVVAEGLGFSLGALYTSGLRDISGDFGSALKHRVLALQVGLLYRIFD